jgi:hypothetical protein
MKQIISFKVDTPASVQHFITTWKRLKHYPQTDYLTIGEALELIKSTSRFLRKEDIASGVYNWLLSADGLIFGYDGDEPIEVLMYITVQTIKKYLAINSKM